jgi:hypothetical protein
MENEVRTSQLVLDCFFLIEMADFDLPRGARLAKANNNRSQVTTEQFYSRKYVVSKDCSAARQRVTAKPPPTPKKKKKRLELMKHLARQKEECLADDKLRTMRIR